MTRKSRPVTQHLYPFSRGLKTISRMVFSLRRFVNNNFYVPAIFEVGILYIYIYIYTCVYSVSNTARDNESVCRDDVLANAKELNTLLVHVPDFPRDISFDCILRACASKAYQTRPPISVGLRYTRSAHPCGVFPRELPI